MIIDLETAKKISDSKMYIAKGNKDIYECIRKPTNLKFTLNLNQYSEANFQLYYKGNENSFDDIETNTRVHIDNLGWWMSTTPTYTNENGIKSKDCKLYSIEYELSQKNLNSFYINSGEDGSIDGVTFYNENDTSKSLLNLALEKASNWSVGYIHPELINKQRTFSIESINIYSFLTEEVAKTLQCIFIFDTENYTVSAYPIKHFGEYMDVYLSNETVIKTLTQSPIDENGITNCIRVTGSDDLDIRAVNCGFEYIYDLSYFYNRMSDNLLTAWKSYISIWNDNKESFKKSQLEHNKIENIMMNLKDKQPDDAKSENWDDYGIDELELLLKTVETSIKDYEKQGYNYSISPFYTTYIKYLEKRNALNSALSNKKKQYSSYETQLKDIANEIIAIKSKVLLSNNFTSDQLVELSQYIKEGDYNDTTFAITDIYTEEQIQQKQYDLMVSATEALSSLAQPQYQIQTDIINLMKIPAFEINYKKIALGNFIVVYLDKNYSLDERIVSLEFSSQNGDEFAITFSNSTRSVTGMSDLDYLLNNSTGVSSSSYTNSSGSGGSGGSGSSKNSNDYVTRAELSTALMNMSMGGAVFSSEQINALEKIADGKIDTIDSNYIYTKLLEVEQAKFDELASKIITAEWIEAHQAIFDFVKVKDFEAYSGKINTLLSGNISSWDMQTINLTSKNVTFEEGFIKSLIAEYITAKAIFGDSISTNEFKILSESGHLSIFENVIQFRDKNNIVRIQIGEDTDGNFTFFVLDDTGKGTLIDSTGVKEKAIADGLIKSEKLASKSNTYDGISADKLNIDSVVTGINNGTTSINSTKVYFDSDNKSLNTIMQEITTKVTRVDGKLLYDVVITSSNGTTITDTTVLTANIYDYGTTTIATGNFTYQWYLNGTVIKNATEKTYTVDASSLSNGGQFTCKVNYEE